MARSSTPRAGAVRWGRVVLTTVLFGFLAASGRAATTPSRKAKPQVQVLIAGADDGRSQTALTEGLRRSWERLGVEMSVTAVAAIDPREVASGDALPAGLLARVWIDLVTLNLATVYVTEGRNIFRRRLRVDRGLDSVGLDLLEVVIASSVETILSGGQLGISRDEFIRSLPAPAAPSPPPTRTPPSEQPPRQTQDQPPQQPTPRPAEQTPPQPPAPAPPSVPVATAEPPVNTGEVVPTAAGPPADLSDFVRATILYEVVLVSSTKATHGPGLHVEGQRGAVRLGLGLLGHFPYEVVSGGETLQIFPAGLRLSIGRAFAMAPTTTFVVSLGAGVDVTHIRATPLQGADVVPSDPFWVVDPVVRPLAQVEWRFGRLSAGAALGFDIDIRGSEYVERIPPTGTRVTWTPWRVRPLAALLGALTF